MARRETKDGIRRRDDFHACTEGVLLLAASRWSPLSTQTLDQSILMQMHVQKISAIYTGRVGVLIRKKCNNEVFALQTVEKRTREQNKRWARPATRVE